MNQNRDYEYEDTDEELEETKEVSKDKKSKPKKVKKTKKVTKKQKSKTPKQKIVYKYRDKKSHSGIWLFLLTLIILALLAVIGYLIYVNYYMPEESPNNPNNKTDDQSEKICTSKASKYNISSGLAKCSNDDNFKLVIYTTDLSFDIARTNDENLPYIIKQVYYKENPINTKITGMKVNENWKMKTEDDVIYLLLEQGSSNGMQSLIVFKEGNVIYSGNNANYKLTSDVTYTKYTSLGLEEIATCDVYEEKGTLESELWTEGKLIYKDGTITEEPKETVLAKDACKN